MAISLSYDLKELKNLDKKVIEFANFVNSEELAGKIAKVLWDNTLERFVSKVDPSGKRWKPTIRGGSILEKRGLLRDSIEADSDSDTIIIGTNKRYAAIHQFGGEIKIPARKAKVYHSINEKTNLFNRQGKFVKKKEANFVRDVNIRAYKINMPARAYLGISGIDEEDISLIFSKMIEKDWAK